MRGTVLAVFRRSFYLRGDAGGLVCLGDVSTGAGPLNVLFALPGGWDWEAAGLRPGAWAHMEGGTLRVGPRHRFSLAAARDWRPPMPARDWRADDLRRGLSALAAHAGTRAPAEGLGRLIPALAGRQPIKLPPPENPVLAMALPAVSCLRGWLKEVPSRRDVPAAAEALIGLGPGLTPSGDDFVGGAMIALRALGRPDAAGRLGAWAIGLARHRTGTISFAHLACAAAGQGAGALHAALSAVAAPGEPGLSACLDAVDGVGHTSGWDALAGAVAAANGQSRTSSAAS